MAILNVTPLMALGSMVMTIDPLSVLFWTAAMVAGWRAVQPGGSTRQWLWVGTLDGLGIAEQIHQFIPVDLLGGLLRALAARAAASAPARTLAGAAPRGGLPAAHRDLECAAPLDHHSACGQRRPFGPAVGTHFHFGFPVAGRSRAASVLLCGRALGGGGVLAAETSRAPSRFSCSAWARR